MSNTISMVDLPRIHAPYQNDLDEAIRSVVHGGGYIGGPVVKEFEAKAASFLGAPVIGVGNGTDALQIALMALGVKAGDEVIVPAFTYAASAEVIGLLGGVAVWCDVNESTFTIDPNSVRAVLSDKTIAIIAVHLYGQCADIEALETIAPGIPIVEDTAQAFGAAFTKGRYAGKYAGTVGAIGTFSFFPTKNLGALGDGGAIASKNDQLLAKAKSIASHGQSEKYRHDQIGVNSRLDPIQAAALKVKLNHLPQAIASKVAIAGRYLDTFGSLRGITLPTTASFSNHTYHQFTLRIQSGQREAFTAFMLLQGIATMIYYPIPLHKQKAYMHFKPRTSLEVSERLSDCVVSLPVHEALENHEILAIENAVTKYFS
ncbi:MAG: DegT/DnrJ/EryC1/StrS family aminotransferase [Schleiferiaceae bacterium]|nr:DegT/DnrJ/EryC1/StrS family aminotransferase [Schleiferiaceae bacterium]